MVDIKKMKTEGLHEEEKNLDTELNKEYWKMKEDLYDFKASDRSQHLNIASEEDPAEENEDFLSLNNLVYILFVSLMTLILLSLIGIDWIPTLGSMLGTSF